MLWPDSDEANARSNLRHALWKLGDALGKRAFVADKLNLSSQSRGGGLGRCERI